MERYLKDMHLSSLQVKLLYVLHPLNIQVVGLCDKCDQRVKRNVNFAIKHTLKWWHKNKIFPLEVASG